MTVSIRVIEPIGVFDGVQAAKFCNDIEQLVKNKVKIIVIDFKAVNFMDSSGLGALVQAFKMTRQGDVKLLLCSFNEQVAMLFELTGMDRVFETFSGREELEQKIDPLSPS
ncbi:MAG: STAS domain-containing protein, partial [Microcystaceae cyanobacterium]